MPNISILTPELNSSVIRPSVLSIIEQLKDITNIPKNTRILYVDHLDSGYQKGSTMTQQAGDDLDRANFGFSDQITIDVNITYDEGNISSTAVSKPEQIPIFDDRNLGVIIRPIYSRAKVVISVAYRSASVNEGKKWRDGIRMNISNMRDINLHDVTYHFGVPNMLINILREIYKLREATDGYGQTMDEYFSENFTSRVSTVANQSGTQKQLAVSEKQMQILGLYDFEIAPEKGEPDSQGSAWTTSFDYKFDFDVPIGSNMRYPIMVHNQILDESFYRFGEKAYDIDKVDKARSMSLSALSQFESTVSLEKYDNERKIVNIPEYDEFHYTNVLHGTIPLFSALCSVDPATPRLLLNLKDLGDFGIDSDIMEFLKEEYFYLTKPYKSIFFVNLYKFSGQVPDREIMVDADLNVLSRERDLSMRVNHRVVLNIMKDLTYLDRESLGRLKRHKKAAVKVLTALNVNRGILNQIAHHVNFNSLMPDLPGTGMELRRLQMQYYQTNTVLTSIVVAHKHVDKSVLNSYKLRKP